MNRTKVREIQQKLIKVGRLDLAKKFTEAGGGGMKPGPGGELWYQLTRNSIDTLVQWDSNQANKAPRLRYQIVQTVKGMRDMLKRLSPEAQKMANPLVSKLKQVEALGDKFLVASKDFDRGLVSLAGEIAKFRENVQQAYQQLK